MATTGITLRHFVAQGRKIVAIGRNYSDHAKELGNAIPSKPFFFLKPTTSYITQPQSIVLPYPTIDVHHEVELGLVVSKKAKDVSEADALNYIGGYTVALDLTARNEQDEAKKKSLPWTVSKGFDTFCPVSEFIPKERIADPQNVELLLTINGVTKQHGNTSNMIFKIPQLISFISKVMTLEPNDLILTGTPAGVGSIHAGDVLVASIPNVVSATFNVVNKK